MVRLHYSLPVLLCGYAHKALLRMRRNSNNNENHSQEDNTEPAGSFRTLAGPNTKPAGS